MNPLETKSASVLRGIIPSDTSALSHRKRSIHNVFERLVSQIKRSVFLKNRLNQRRLLRLPTGTTQRPGIDKE